MQQILNVVTPATSYDLVSLDEMKMKLGIPPTDTSRDALLQELITNISSVAADKCCRHPASLVYETVDEKFYQLEDGCSRRLFLSQWPVVRGDITSMTQDGVDLLTNTDWILEEKTGTLYMPPAADPWFGVIEITYSGGYKNPDEVPGSLKFVVEAVLRESYMAWIRNPSMFGVRQIAHKEARVGYYGPNMFPTIGLSQTWDTCKGILNKYIRHWV
jgi:hypothetical protein